MAIHMYTDIKLIDRFKRLAFNYHLLRAYKNTRLVSLYKALQLLAGHRVYVYPSQPLVYRDQ